MDLSISINDDSITAISCIVKSTSLSCPACLLFYYVLHEKPLGPGYCQKTCSLLYWPRQSQRALQGQFPWTEGWDRISELLLRDVFIHGTGLFIKILALSSRDVRL